MQRVPCARFYTNRIYLISPRKRTAPGNRIRGEKWSRGQKCVQMETDCKQFLKPKPGKVREYPEGNTKNFLNCNSREKICNFL